MKNLIITIFEAVITVTVPIVAGAVVTYLKKKNITAETQAYITEVTEAVITAVTATSQMYVDRLKKEGSFDAEAQAKAKANAINTALDMISDAAQQYIVNNYGNIKDYLANKVEETVRKQKTE